MAILAQLEVDDDGSLKIQNFRDALSDLGASVVKTKEQIEQANRAGATSAKAQADAVTQLTAAHRAAIAEQQKYAQGFGVLQSQLRAGTTVSQAQASALQQLGTATQNNTKFSAQYGAEMNALVGHLRAGTQVTPQLAAQLGQVAQGFQQTTAGANATGAAMGGIKAQAVALAAVFAVVGGGLFSLLNDSAQLAARIETLGVVMNVVGKNAGITSFAMQTQVESIKRLGITTKEATDTVLQFVQANLKISDASKIARAAQDLAVVAGENSSQTVKRLTAAIQTGETMLLRQVGIVTTNEAIWKEYAKTINKNVKELDAFDKKQAMVNKILSEAEKSAGAYEQSMTTAGKQLTSFSRYTEEASLKLGQALVPVLGLAIKVATEFLKWWIALDPAIAAGVSAILAGAAAVAVFSAALAGMRLLGIIELLQKLWAGVVAVQAAFTGGGIAAGAGALLTFSNVVGLVIVALGLATAAYVYFSSKVDTSVDLEVKAAAVAQDRINSLEKTRSTLVELGGVTDKTAGQQLQYNRALDSLEKLSPAARAALDNIKGGYDAMGTAVDKAIEQERTLQRELLKGMVAKQAIVKQEYDEAQTRIKSSNDVVGALAKQLAAAKAGAVITEKVGFSTGMGGGIRDQVVTIEQLEDRLKKATKAAAETVTPLQEVRGKYDSITQSIQGLKAVLPEYAEETKKANQAAVADELTEASKKYKDLADRVKVAKQSMKSLSEAPDVQTFRARLNDINEAWDKHTKELEKQGKKAKTAIDNLIASVRDNDPIDMAKFRTAAQLLSETGLSAEEYGRRVQKLKPIIDAFSKSNDPAVKGIKALQDAANSLDMKAYEDALEKGIIANKKLDDSLNDKLIESARNAAKELEALQLSTNNKLYEMKLAQVDREREVGEQIKEATILPRLKAVDQALYAEDKRLAAIKRGYDKEKEARDHALQLEREAVNRRAELAQEEIKIYVDKINREAELQLKLQQNRVSNMLPGSARDAAAAELRAAEVVRQLDRDTLSQYQTNQNAQIESHRQAQQSILDQQQKANSAVDASNTKLTKDQIDASAKVRAQIIKDHDAIRKAVIDLGKQVALQFVDGFAEMAKGAKSFKDVITGIFSSIRDALFNVVKQMVSNWIEGIGKMKAAQMAAGTGGSGGSGGVSVGGGTSKLGAYAGAAGIGLMAGGIAGRYADGSYAKGAIGGAAAGAGAGAAYGSIVPGIGTGIGAGIGAIAGGIGGFFAARKQRKEMQTDREQLIKDMGGLEEFKRKATEAGFAYDKLLSTKSPKDFGAEVKKLQESLEKLDLKKARADMIEAAGGADKLAKSMQLVGFNADKMLKTESVSEYNAEVKKLNDLLDAQKKRMEGLGTAASGFAAMVSGFAMTVQKEIDSGKKGGVDEKDVIKNFQSDWQARFNTMGMVASAVFGRVLRETGDIVQAMNAIAEPMDKLIELQDKLGLAADGSFGKLMQLRRTIKDNEDIATSLSGITQVLSGLSQAGGLTAELFNSMGADAAQLFNMLTERGASADTALLLMQPTLQALYEAQKKFGFATDEATQKLIDMGVQNGIVGDQFQSVNQQMLDVLLLIADVLGADIPEAYRKQADAAKAAGDTSKAALDGTSQAAEQTKRKIDEVGGVANNAGKILRDEFGNVIGVLDGVEGAWGGVEDSARRAAAAMRDAGQAGVEAGQATEEAATGAAEGHSPTGIKQIIIRANEAMATFKAFKDSMVNDSTNMESAATDVSDKIDLIKRMADAGINPDSLNKIYQAAQEQNNGADPTVTDTVNAPAAAAAAASAAAQPVTIQMEIKPEFTISGLDGADIERVVRDSVGPEMLGMLRSNTDQMAVQIEEALSRYRRGE